MLPLHVSRLTAPDHYQAFRPSVERLLLIHLLISTQIASLSLLRALCEVVLEILPSTAAEDAQLLRTSVAGNAPLHTAVEYRLGKKRLIQAARECLSARIQVELEGRLAMGMTKGLAGSGTHWREHG